MPDLAPSEEVHLGRHSGSAARAGSVPDGHDREPSSDESVLHPATDGCEREAPGADRYSHQCVAVSVTSDATGAYYLYDFLTDGTDQ